MKESKRLLTHQYYHDVVTTSAAHTQAKVELRAHLFLLGVRELAPCHAERFSNVAEGHARVLFDDLGAHLLGEDDVAANFTLLARCLLGGCRLLLDRLLGTFGRHSSETHCAR